MANSFWIREMVGNEGCARKVESCQVLETTELMPILSENISEKSTEFVCLNLNKSREISEIERRGGPQERSISRNSLRVNDLDATGIAAERQQKRKLKPGRWSRATATRWVKFNFVGAIGIVVQFAALFLLKSVLHFNYLFATAIAVEAAVMHNFVWHEQFTWADRVQRPSSISPRSSPARFLRFNLTTGLVSMLGNLALMKSLVGSGHVNYLAANGIAIVLCSLANFLVSDEWVFG